VLEKLSPELLHHLRAPRIGLENIARRDEWVRAALGRLAPGSRILDAGAGERPYFRFCQHLNYVAQDFGRYDGVGDGRGLQSGHWDQGSVDIICDIAHIPEPDASFDAILCTEVIEHVPEPIPVIRELSRLLRPGGILILTAPFISFTHFSPYHYHTGFSRHFYEYHLTKAGLEIDELSFNGNFFELLAQEVRRIPWAVEHYSGTPVSAWASFVSRLFLRVLSQLNYGSHGSENFAAFGLHVIAKRGA
jgi:SAM-dependent methyltransferase